MCRSRWSVLSATVASLLLWEGQQCEAWVIQSISNSDFATGFTRHSPSERVVIIGTNFFDPEDVDDSTAGGVNGTSDFRDTDCSVLVASIQGEGYWNRVEFETPQLCMGGGVVLDTPSTGDHPDGTAVIVGIEGNDAQIVSITTLGDQPTEQVPITMDTAKVPVFITQGDTMNDFVYVAMHDTGGSQFQPPGIGRAGTLKGLTKFYETFTSPKLLAIREGGHTPELLQINPTTGNVGFRGIFDVAPEGSSAAIASIGYESASLIVVGSANGSGELYGDGKGDWDGFIGFVSPITGKVETLFMQPGTVELINRGNIRVDWGPSQTNNFLHDHCQIDDFLYAVGTTDPYPGSLGDTYVIKVDLTAREVTVQRKVDLAVAFQNRIRGLRIECSETHVFVAGQVEFDASLFDQEQNVFVTALSPNLEVVFFESILDSSSYFGEVRTDHLVDITVNPFGNINVLWNSLDFEDGINHVLMVNVDRFSGNHDLDETSSSGGGLENADFSTDPPTVAPTKKTPTTIEVDEKNVALILGLALGLPIALAILVIIYSCTCASSKSEIEILTAEEVEKHGDLALHESAPGDDDNKIELV